MEDPSQPILIQQEVPSEIHKATKLSVDNIKDDYTLTKVTFIKEDEVVKIASIQSLEVHDARHLVEARSHQLTDKKERRKDSIEPWMVVEGHDGTSVVADLSGTRINARPSRVENPRGRVAKAKSQ